MAAWRKMLHLWLAAWQGRDPEGGAPGGGGVSRRPWCWWNGVAAYPQSVTAQMVADLWRGRAINRICKTFWTFGLKVFELALNCRPATSPRMLPLMKTPAPPPWPMERGDNAGGCSLLCIGEMGIGNTTIAAALAHGLYGGTAETGVGMGTGVDAEGLKRKADAVRHAVALHQPHLGDPFGGVRSPGRAREDSDRHGGRHPGRAHAERPVLVDGYVATAAPGSGCCAGPSRRRWIAVAWPPMSREAGRGAARKDRQGATCRSGHAPWRGLADGACGGDGGRAGP